MSQADPTEASRSANRDTDHAVADEAVDDQFLPTLCIRTGTPPAPQLSVPQVPPPLQQLGDYRILRELGRGGMGVVYEAEQQSLQRRVALKVLPLHASFDQVALERFRREARSAALLHHTNIVPIFEIGEAGDVCYYAMQFIAGRGFDAVIQSLRAANTSEELPLPRRGTAEFYSAVARLGRQISDALAYAHARGIVHRDIKPSNLLLDAVGAAWITDFGLAKQLDDKLTEPGDVLGTLRYMPPERFHGDGDGRSDVYSLGLTLYELLTLQPAYPSIEHPRLMEQVTRHDPPRPRRIDPRIPKDLETIVLKAMDKDPQRRYAHAEAMSEDLHRFLMDEPILARPVGVIGRGWRWAKRHPAVAGLSAAVVLLVLTVAFGATFAAISYHHLAEQEHEQSVLAQKASTLAQAETERANLETASVQEVATFLMGLLDETDPLALSGRTFGAHHSHGQRPTGKELLDRAAERVQNMTSVKPTVRAALLDKIGTVYVSMGNCERARKPVEEALALRREAHGEIHADVGASWHSLGYLHFARGDASAAEDAYRQAVHVRRAVLGEKHPLVAETLIHLGLVRGHEIEGKDAEPILQEALAIQRSHYGADSRQAAIALIAVLELHIFRGDMNKALPLVPQALKLIEKHEGKQGLGEAANKFIKGQFAAKFGQHREAAALIREALVEGEKILGRTHFFMIHGRYCLAELYHGPLKDLAAAEAQFRLIYDLKVESGGPRSGEAANSLMHLGRVLRDQERYPEAEEALVRAHDLMHDGIGDRARCLHILGVVRVPQKKLDSAEAALRESVKLRREKSERNSFWMGQALDQLVNLLLHQNKRADAIADLRLNLPVLDQHQAPTKNDHLLQANRWAKLVALLRDEPKSDAERDAAASRGVASLRAAAAAGARDDFARLDSLAPLRSEPAFEAFLRELKR